MTANMPSLERQLAGLRDQLAKLESLRSLLGDKVTDQKAEELQSRIRALVETSGGAFVAGGVGVREGDFVARDKWQLWVEKLYLGSSPDQVPPEVILINGNEMALS